MLLADPNVSNDYNIERVLFEISLEPRHIISFNDTPYALISEQSYFSVENELLFSIGAIFRIANVEKEESKLWKIRLVHMESSESPLYKKDVNDLNKMYEYMKE